MSQEITKEQIAAFDADFSAQRANRVAMNAVTNNGLLASAIRREAVEQDVHEYSISLEQGEICNQKQSGRCWMFAALNTLRYQVMKKYDLKTFELSQAYLFFWDKLEKSNYFLESILDTLDEPANGKTKAENIAAVRAYLERTPELYPAMKRQQVGVTVGGTPALPDDAPVMFGDLVQIADYDTLEDANGYPPSKAHMDLVEFSTPMLKKVTAIDFEVAE